jgi:hypothetical protein
MGPELTGLGCWLSILSHILKKRAAEAIHVQVKGHIQHNGEHIAISAEKHILQIIAVLI